MISADKLGSYKTEVEKKDEKNERLALRNKVDSEKH